ncbi:MAG: META domain-containing protein [Hyphomicrobiaceae bacterium]|nr:META domain-containing protein [Hyphomicrobiaceae bacterium]
MRPFRLSLSAILVAFVAAVALSAIVTNASWAGSSLAGRWSIVSLNGGKLATPAGDITFETGDRTINGATACNFFRGTFETSGETDLAIHVGTMTRRGCSGPAAESERAFLRAMAEARAFRIDGDRLELTGTDSRSLVELLRSPDAALEGQMQKIVSYYHNGGLYSAGPDTGPSISFNGGRIEGTTGCRGFTAHYKRDGTRLEVSDVVYAEPQAPCAEDTQDQDAAIVAALPRITAFDTNRNLIRLLDKPDGAAMFWITPAGQ